MSGLARYDRDSSVLRNFEDCQVMTRWLTIELAAAEALNKTGVIGLDTLDALRLYVPRVDDDFVASVRDREREIGHDVAAFVDVLHAHYERAQVGHHARWLHYGLTSSDLVDTALHANIYQSLVTIGELADLLLTTIERLAIEDQETLCCGRTHGQVGEPTTWGIKLALLGFTLSDDRDRLRMAAERCRVGKLAGPVGTHTVFTHEQEQIALAILGVEPVPGTQVIGRQRIADAMWACAQVCTTIEQFALEIRLLARSDVREVSEATNSLSKGSSSMPHKRNPILAERLCGIARVVRASLGPALEDVPLWHERDISHSSVERIVIPDTLVLTRYAVAQCLELLGRLVVDRDQMQANYAEHRSEATSHVQLSGLIADGQDRDTAYRTVQSAPANTGVRELEAATLAHSRHLVRAYRERLDNESST